MSQTAPNTGLSTQQLTDKAPSGPAGPPCQLDILHVAICTFTKGVFPPYGASRGLSFLDGSSLTTEREFMGCVVGCTGIQMPGPKGHLTPSCGKNPRAPQIHQQHTGTRLRTHKRKCIAAGASTHTQKQKTKKKFRSYC